MKKSQTNTPARTGDNDPCNITYQQLFIQSCLQQAGELAHEAVYEALARMKADPTLEIGAAMDHALHTIGVDDEPTTDMTDTPGEEKAIDW